MPNFIIETNNLCVNYGTFTALNNITVSIPERSIVTIVGPNGGGKTTFLKTLLGLVEPQSGTIRINGMKPSELPPSLMSYVPQIKTLDRSFPALPIELVATGIRRNWVARLSNEEKKASLAALAQVGAEHLARRPLYQLSGGELQRIYLARSIISKPKILMLDEPVTGIDAAGESDFNKQIDNFRKSSDVTVLMITHDWEAAYHHADYVLLLNRNLVCFDVPDKAFSEQTLRQAFGHTGHAHEMTIGARHHE